MNSSSRIIFRAAQSIATRTRNASTNVPVSPNYQKMKARQSEFGADDGIPVHLKGGRFDRLLYYGTAALIIGTSCEGIHTFIKLVFK